MPIYEFSCENCKKEFEVLVRSERKVGTPLCPDCRSSATRKKISKSSFQLKGGGWAFDGYGS